VGDSITDAARWNEMFPGLIIANRGIDGDTIGGLSQRVDAIIATRAETIFLMIGINDIFGGNEIGYIARHYEDVAGRLKPRARLIIQSTLQCSRDMCSDGQRAKIDALNAELQKIAKRLGVTYVDLNARFAPEGSLSPAYTYDGVHLNSAGFALWRDMLAAHMPQTAG
jgi:lysophospholipase L1-like esterase